MVFEKRCSAPIAPVSRGESGRVIHPQCFAADLRVLLPKRNRKDVEADLPESVRGEITFVFLSTVDQAIEEVFGKDIWRQGEGTRIEARL